MRFSTTELERALQPVVGLWLAQIYYAANMKGFWFIQPNVKSNQVRGWCLHVSCTWRLESKDGIVTGSYDWTEHVVRKDILSEEWDPAKGGSLQESILRKLLKDDSGEDRTIRNRTNLLTVKHIKVDECGGFRLIFDRNYELVAFPSTTRGEMWRIFPDYSEDQYFVAEVD